MVKRSVTITLEKAIEWYNSDDESLKDLALQAFSKEELMHNFMDITTFKKACDALDYNYDDIVSKVNSIAEISRAFAAMFKLGCIRKALNLGQNLRLTKCTVDSYIYYPLNPFVTESSIYYKNEIDSGRMEVIGKIKSEGKVYNVIGNAAGGSCVGLGSFNPHEGVAFSFANIGFLGCASEDIARHFGKYFGMLITEAKYADMIDFKIIEEKYKI